jgi:NAD(P)-dependent dehydrogenase (short-subunit alcohol dehydrogenase family)
MAYTYVVTGASRGIGLEFVRVLADRGDRVIATARTPDSARDLAAVQGKVRIVQLDVSDPVSIRGFSARIGDEPIDVLINNAGIASRGSKLLVDLNAEELASVFMVNSIAPLLVVRELIGHLRKGGRKTVVQISSQLGSIANNSGGSSYGYRASKTALNQLNRSLANELRPDGFTCVAMHPGWVRTDMGGAGADLPVHESVAHLVRVIDGLKPDRSGSFLNYDGTPLPW